VKGSKPSIPRNTQPASKVANGSVPRNSTQQLFSPANAPMLPR
jgi:hypothetical protein